MRSLAHVRAHRTAFVPLHSRYSSLAPQGRHPAPSHCASTGDVNTARNPNTQQHPPRTFSRDVVSFAPTLRSPRLPRDSLARPPRATTDRDGPAVIARIALSDSRDPYTRVRSRTHCDSQCSAVQCSAVRRRKAHPHHICAGTERPTTPPRIIGDTQRRRDSILRTIASLAPTHARLADVTPRPPHTFFAHAAHDLYVLPDAADGADFAGRLACPKAPAVRADQRECCGGGPAALR